MTPSDEIQRELLTEHNDCSVTALVMACSVDYVTAWSALAAAGRKHRKGVYNRHLEAALDALGVRFERFRPRCATLNFWQHAADGRAYIVHVHRHFTVYAQGAFHDWVAAEVLRCKMAWRICDAPHSPGRAPGVY